MQQTPPAQPSDTDDRLRRLAYDFISTNRAAAFATTDSAGRPHVSIVYCIVGTDLRLYFSTRVEGRKFGNLTDRPNVAMAFHDEPRLQMIQLTGTARRVEDLDKEQHIMGELMKLRYGDPDWPLPTVQLFHRGATTEIALVEVTPSEMTFADFSTPRTGHYTPAFQKII